jgi:hypothetical protein
VKMSRDWVQRALAAIEGGDHEGAKTLLREHLVNHASSGDGDDETKEAVQDPKVVAANLSASERRAAAEAGATPEEYAMTKIAFERGPKPVRVGIEQDPPALSGAFKPR